MAVCIMRGTGVYTEFVGLWRAFVVVFSGFTILLILIDHFRFAIPSRNLGIHHHAIIAHKLYHVLPMLLPPRKTSPLTTGCDVRSYSCNSWMSSAPFKAMALNLDLAFPKAVPCLQSLAGKNTRANAISHKYCKAIIPLRLQYKMSLQ